MEFPRTYKSFINSHYVNEGIRITAGILFPAFLMSFFDQLNTGIIISLGAFFVSGTDSPGPIHHRRNGMLICIASLFLASLISGLVNSSPVLLGISLLVVCFVFSMIGIYGSRATAIGITSLIAFILNIGQNQHNVSKLEYALFVTSGAV